MTNTKTNKAAAPATTDEAPVIAVNGIEPNIEDPKVATPASAGDDAEIPKMAEMQGIRYSGIANIKRLSIADLESISGEPAKGDLEWSADNDFVVPTKDFNAATRDALLALSGFTAV